MKSLREVCVGLKVCFLFLDCLWQARAREFTVNVVSAPEEVKALLEVGFDYVCQKDNLIFMRKRK
jgi:hypothetical protein